MSRRSSPGWAVKSNCSIVLRAGSFANRRRPLESALRECCDLVGEHVGEELAVGGLIPLGGLQGGGEPVRRGGQPQRVEVLANLLVDRVLAAHLDATASAA